MWSSNSGSLITSVLYQVHATPVVRPVSVSKANTILEQGGDPKKREKKKTLVSEISSKEKESKRPAVCMISKKRN
jgi:hypothetical protein